MAEKSPHTWKLKTTPPPTEPPKTDRMPTNAELLHELRLHGAKPPLSPHDLPGMSRRTRDFLLIAGIGSAGIMFAAFKIMPDSEAVTVLRLAMTCIAAYAGLLWYIFYGVMSRY